MSVDDTGGRSAAEIEREVEQSRNRLTDTVQELRDRVSPTQMAEQAMDWVAVLARRSATTRYR